VAPGHRAREVRAGLRRGAGLMLALLLGMAALAVAAPSASAAPAGQVLAWGYNSNGQLGDGSTTDSDVPVDASLPPGVTVTAIAAGEYHSLALTSTGQLLAWGYNSNGQLGDGSTTDSDVPVPVSLPAGTTVTAIAAGGYSSYALTSTGQLLAWGYNGDGELGNGSTTDSDVPVPVSVPVGTTVTAISAGYDFGMVLTSAGQILAWGYNGDGELGNGTTTNSSVPVPVSLPPGTTATGISGNYLHALALTPAGQVLAWGYGGDGELGNGTNTSSTVPVSVSLPPGTTVKSLSQGQGTSSSYVVTTAGQVLAWGYGGDGELGNGGNTDSNVPVFVSLPAGTTVSSAAAGDYHALAVTSTGRVLAWGYNFYGQLGDGTTTDSNVPVTTSLPAGITAFAVAGGYYHSLAIAAAATSATSLSANPNPAAVGQPVTLTATVTCSTGTPTGTVNFLDGGTPIGTSTLGPTGQASMTTSGLTIGSHALTAQYSGDGICPSSTSTAVTEVIQQGTSSTGLSANPPNPAFGQPVTLTAHVTCTAGTAPTGTVTFAEGTTTLGTTPVNGADDASTTLNGLAAGSHTFTAHYSGDTNCAASTSPPLTITVGGRTISGNVFGFLTITQPTILAPGTHVFGIVTIRGNGSLDAEGATIQGALTATGGTGLRMCSSTVTGPTSISGMNGVILIGDAGDDGSPGCGANTLRGTVTLTGNAGSLELGGNQIQAAVTVNNNHTTTISTPPENATTTEIEANRIFGTLACTGNTPPPTNDGKPNTVIGPRTGQCTTL
jgi:alpha-tubulin suppressor-like RCC1 family protein